MKKSIIVSLFILFQILSYAQSKFYSEKIFIDITSASTEIVPMSRLFSAIEYIPLETIPLYRLNEYYAKYYLTSEHIIGVNFFGNAYLFDRKTGKFIKQISKSGTGQDEYKFMPIAVYGFNENNNILFFDDNKQWKGIKIETNKTVTNIVKPKHRQVIHFNEKEITQTSSSNTSISQDKNNKEGDWLIGDIYNPWHLENGKYIGFVNNKTGNINVKLVIFNDKGEVLKSFPNFQTYQRTDADNPYSPGQFYTYNNQTYFKELIYNDTVFLVNEDTITPHIIFQLGDKQMPYEQRNNHKYNKGSFKISFVQETDKYVFFNYTVCCKNAKEDMLISGYYDKESKQTYICETREGQAGFANDFDGILSFNPLYINKDGDFLGVLRPEEILSYYNRVDKSRLSKKALELISKIGVDDNPIILIAYPKK